MRRRGHLLLLLLSAALVAVGCQVKGFVDVRVGADGSGTVAVSVVLDADAVSQIGDLSKVVRVDDLRAAGWTVDAPRVADGSTTIRAEKSFGSPDALGRVMAEVGGPGVFDGWRTSVTDGFASTTVTVDGRVRLDGTLAQFGDSDLTAALDGLPLGRTPEELAAANGGTPLVVPLTIRMQLPAEIVASNGAPTPEASVRQWSFEVGNGSKVDRAVRSSSTRSNSLATTLLVLAGVSVVAAIALAVVPRRRARSTRRARG